MWFEDSAEDKARRDFAKAVHAYADALPANAVTWHVDARRTWNCIADEIEKGSADGNAFYAVFKDTLKLPPQKP